MLSKFSNNIYGSAPIDSARYYMHQFDNYIFLGMSTEEIHSHHGTSTSGILFIYSYHKNNLAWHSDS